MQRVALAVVLLFAVLGASPVQRVSDGELLRFAYEGRFPLGCADATRTANGLRAEPTTDPGRLDAAARIYRACADGPYGRNSNALQNRARFNAAAALLLAARHEPPAAAMSDAAAARALANEVAAYRVPPSTGPRFYQGRPSPLETDALRVARDAGALLSE